MRQHLGKILLVVSLLGISTALLCDGDSEAVGRRRIRVPGRVSGGAVPPYPNNYAINIPGANGDGIVLADAAGLEPTNGAMSWFVQYKEGSTVSADAIIAKFTEGTPNVASFVLDQVSCASSRCRYRVDLCGESTCAKTPGVHTSPTGVLTNNDWTTVGMAMDIPASDLALYVGGAEVGSFSISGAFASWVDTAANWTVGNRSGPGTRAPIARVKRIVYWRNVRVSEQCMWDMANPDGRGRGTGPIPSSCPAATSDCRGGDDNNGAGTTCTDYSGNGNHWTLAGTTSFSASSLPTGFPAQVASTSGGAQKVTIHLGQSNEAGRANYWDYNSPLFAERLQVATWATETVDSGDSGANDVNILFATELVGDTFNIGYNTTFNELRAVNTSGTQGTVGTCVWEYCSAQSGGACTVWTALAGLSDGTTCFTAARGVQLMSWTMPGDWVASSLDGSPNYYYIRARVTGVYTANPIYDWIVGDEDQIFANRSGTGIYDNNGPIGTPNGTTTPPTESLDDNTGQAAVFPTSSDASSVGPILPTLNALRGSYPSYSWYAIPCPLGATSSVDWIVSHGQTGRLAGECESRYTGTALAAGAEIVAIYVYQGEAECSSAVEASRWAPRWAYACEEMRTAVGDRDIPCIFTRMPATVPSGCTGSVWTTLRAAQASICDRLDHCAVVDAPDGPFADADTHLGHIALRSFGTLRGAAFQTTPLGQLITP